MAAAAAAQATEPICLDCGKAPGRVAVIVTTTPEPVRGAVCRRCFRINWQGWGVTEGR